MTVFRRAGPTVSIAATTTTANTAIQSEGRVVQVTNSGTTVAFIAFGPTGIVATAADIPIAGGQTLYFDKAGSPFIAALMSSGTATIYACPGAKL
jgi:hypothetical protein